MTRPIRWSRAPLVPLALLVSACSTVATPLYATPTLHPGEVLLTGIGAVRSIWVEPPNYSFDLEGGSMFASLGGHTRIVVRNHRVVQPKLDSAALESKYFTIAQLQERASQAVARGLFVAVVRAADGRLTFLYTDQPDLTDDEFRVTLSAFVPE